MRNYPLLLLAALTVLTVRAKTTSTIQLGTSSDSLSVPASWSYEVVDLYGAKVAVITGVSPNVIGSLTIPAVVIDTETTPGVPYPVKYVGEGAFANQLGVNSVSLPETLSELGAGAFRNCTSLKSITLNEGLIRIGKRPFENTALTTLAIPDSLQEVDGNPVAGCKSFQSFTLPDSQSYFALSGGALYDKDFEVLYGCPARMETLLLADAAIEISDEAFVGCFRLGSLEIPKGVISIGKAAFADCTRLTALSFAGTHAPALADPDIFAGANTNLVISVPSESTGWLSGESVNVDFPEGSKWPEDAAANNKRTIKRKATSAAGETFKTTSSGNVFWTYRVVNGTAELMGKNGTTAAIPSGTFQTYTWNQGTGQWDPDGRLNVPSSLDGYAVTTIGSNAFLNCSALTTVVLPDSITSVGDFAFSGCSSVNDIELPSRVNTIGYHAFENTSLVSLSLPDGLRTLRGNPAAGCETLLSYSISANHSYFAVSDNVLYDVDLETLISCPARRATVSIPSSVRTIGAEAFRGCFRLSALVMPDSLETVQAYAFVGCSRIEELSFASALAALAGDGLFEGCSKLKKVAMTGNAPSVSNGLFFGAPAGLTVHVGEGTTGWKDASTDLPDDGLWPIGGGTNGRTIIRDTVVIDPYQTSDNWKYRVVDGVAEISGTVKKPTGGVIIPDTLNDCPVKRIAAGALANCPGLTALTMPSGLSEIGANAFAGCDVLSRVTLNSGLRKIGANAFAGTALDALAIPSTVTNLVGNPVIGCDMLLSISVAAGSHSYAVNDDGALFDIAFTQLVACPPNAEELTLPETVVSIAADAFAGCYYLDEVTFLGDAPACADTVFVDTPASLVSRVSCYADGFGSAPGMWRDRALVCYDSPAEPDPEVGDVFHVAVDDRTWTVRLLENCGVEILGVTPQQYGVLTVPATFYRSDTNLHVKAIGKAAFANMVGLTSVSLPATLLELGDFAFSNCNSLASVALNAGLRAIGKSPFANTALTEIVLPDSLMEMDGNIAAGCVNQLAFGVGSDQSHFAVTGDGGLYDKNLTRLYSCPIRQTSLAVPATVTALGDDALAGCFALTNVIFLGNAPACADTLFADTPAALVVSVGAGTTGWKDASIDLPADGLWPATGARRRIVRDVNVESARETIDGVTWTYAIEHGEVVITGVAVDGDFEGTLTLPTVLGGCYVADVTADAFDGVAGVEAFDVENDNAAFTVRDGVLYSADGKTLVRVPNTFTFAATTVTRTSQITTSVAHRAEEGMISTDTCKTNGVVTTSSSESVEPTVSVDDLFAGVTRIADGAFSGCGAGGASSCTAVTNSSQVTAADAGVTADKRTWATSTTTYVVTESAVEYEEKMTVPGGVSYSRTRAFANSNFTEVTSAAPKMSLSMARAPGVGGVSLVCPTVAEKVYTVWRTESLGGTWTKVAEFAGTGEAREFIDAAESSAAFYKVTVETAK